MDLATRIGRELLVFDGAMGTGIQLADPGIEAFEGHEGLNEWLSLSRPDLIRDLHRAYFDAGSDIVETNTFGAFPVVLDEFGLGSHARELGRASATLAREAALQASAAGKPRYVAGSVGPGTRLPSLGHIAYRDLAQSYFPLIKGLLEGGVDLLLIETCQDPLQARAAFTACRMAFEACQLQVPIGLQITMEATGTMLLGTEAQAALTTLGQLQPAFFGLNCATGPEAMLPHLQILSRRSPFPLSVQPNAGLPRTEGGRMIYDLEPEAFAEWQLRYVKDLGVSIVGGCCGTRPEHLEALVRKLRTEGDSTPAKRSPAMEDSVCGLYHATELSQDPAPLLVGERTNANGSRAFRKALEAEDWESLIEIARQQEEEGAHVLDVCVAAVSRNELSDMCHYLDRLRRECTLPLMIDSTEPEVVKAALELLGGRAIINSINLEDGEGRARKLLELCREHGSAVVALCIDEEGMAQTADRKLQVALRLMKLAAEYGLKPGDLLFDPLTFTLGSGDAEYRYSARHTLEAITRIKEEIPGCRTLLGLSNISFGLKPSLRRVLNSVFLGRALDAGMDAAILHAGKIMHPQQIDERQRELCLALIDGDHSDGDPLAELLESAGSEISSGQEASEEEFLPVGERLQRRIVQGRIPGIEAELNIALQDMDPFRIINEYLLEGMREVGELFGAGKMQLPFVLKSAETMKQAVAILEPEIKKSKQGAWRDRGRLLLATVRGDVHDIGKNLVGILLRNNGYEVVDLGIKVPVEAIMKGIREHKPDAVGLSGLLVKSTLVMRENLEVFNAEGLKPPVILGGAALNRRFVEGELRDVYHGVVHYARDAFEGLRILADLGSGVLPSTSEATPGTGADPGEQDTRPPMPAAAPPGKSLDPRSDHAPPGATPEMPDLITPPWWGSRLETPSLDEVWPWLNLQTLTRGEWGFKRGRLEAEEWEKIERETIAPLLAELKAEAREKQWLQPRILRGWYPVRSEGRRLWIWSSPGEKEPRWHLDFPRQAAAPWHCISDYFRPVTSEDFDVLGVQWVTVGAEATLEAKRRLDADRYSDYLYVHGLGVETAEALAEYVHYLMRKDLGIAGEDSPDLHKLLRQGYRGSRYSFGYPACPRLEDQRILAEMLDVSRIGCTLSEEWQIEPEQSTSAIVVHHPAAKYFSVE